MAFNATTRVVIPQNDGSDCVECCSINEKKHFKPPLSIHDWNIFCPFFDDNAMHVSVGNLRRKKLGFDLDVFIEAPVVVLVVVAAEDEVSSVGTEIDGFDSADSTAIT